MRTAAQTVHPSPKAFDARSSRETAAPSALVTTAPRKRAEQQPACRRRRYPAHCAGAATPGNPLRLVALPTPAKSPIVGNSFVSWSTVVRVVPCVVMGKVQADIDGRPTSKNLMLSVRLFFPVDARRPCRLEERAAWLRCFWRSHSANFRCAHTVPHRCYALDRLNAWIEATAAAVRADDRCIPEFQALARPDFPVPLHPHQCWRAATLRTALLRLRGRSSSHSGFLKLGQHDRTRASCAVANAKKTRIAAGFFYLAPRDGLEPPTQ